MSVDINIPKEILLRAVVSQNVKKLRKKSKMTQDELAIRTGINRVTIVRYEQCQMSMGLDRLLAIAKALDVSPNDLLEGWENLY